MAYMCVYGCYKWTIFVIMNVINGLYLCLCMDGRVYVYETYL